VTGNYCRRHHENALIALICTVGVAIGLLHGSLEMAAAGIPAGFGELAGLTAGAAGDPSGQSRRR
jgi:hypothetical protein